MAQSYPKNSSLTRPEKSKVARLKSEVSIKFQVSSINDLSLATLDLVKT